MSAFPLHEDGVYFGLAEATYHADPALGSTDIRRLLSSPPDYWWHSAHNPLREEPEDTPSKVFGTALHKFVLEGEAAFRRRYVEKPGGDGILVTDADLRAWLANRTEAKMPRSKEDKIVLALQVDPDAPILDVLVAKAVAAGKIVLKAADFGRILLSGMMITANPELAGAFMNGAAEVSVFWTGEDGVRRKARIDYLKIRGCGDLKSCANPRDLAFDQACLRAISSYRYDLQAAHYVEGREALRRLATAGAVHGNHDATWLKKVAAQDEYGWAWVFYQSAGAPITWATTLTPGANQILDVAADHVATAVANFRAFSAEFGLENPWVLKVPMQELDINDLPAWFGRA